MKPYFSKATFQANDTRALPPCAVVQAKLVTGTVTIKFEDGDEITLVQGDVFTAPWLGHFRKIQVTTAAASTATIVYGNGAIQSAIGAGGVQDVTGSREGVLDASRGQWAYEAATGALWVNSATSGTTGWVNIIAAP